MQKFASLVRSWQGRLVAFAGILIAVMTVGANAAQIWDVACSRLLACATPAPTTAPGPLPTPALPQVRITYIEYMPVGDQLAEFVQIENQGLAPTDVTGWTLCDVKDHCYTFPTFVLAAGASAKVWSGSGTNTARDLYWGLETPIWNNEGGDTAFIRNANREPVCELGY